MATNEQMQKEIRRAHAKIQALRQHQRALENKLELQQKEIEGFGKQVKDLSRSIQRAAHANYSAIDQRLKKLERPDTSEAEAEAADALADLPINER